MNQLFLSDSYQNNENILYIKESLSNLIFSGLEQGVTADNFRVGLLININDDVNTVASEEIIDKISDVIAIGYKYKFFKQKINTLGLTPIEYELLLTALISADLKEDKRYIRSKFKRANQVAIDGFFHFKLVNLRKKWEEICTYIPEYFYNDELKEFIKYLIKEKNGKRITVDDNKVLDRYGNLLNKRKLLGDYNRLPMVKEALLSCSGEIFIKKLPKGDDGDFLKEYFVDKILYKVD